MKISSGEKCPNLQILSTSKMSLQTQYGGRAKSSVTFDGVILVSNELFPTNTEINLFSRFLFISVNLPETLNFVDYLGWFELISQSQDGGKERQRQRQQQIKILYTARSRRIVR